MLIDEHDPRTERADVVIRSLHQLPTRGGTGTRKVSGRIFGRAAHIENVQRARGVVCKIYKRVAVDVLHAASASDSRSAGFGPGKRFGTQRQGVGGIYPRSPRAPQ